MDGGIPKRIGYARDGRGFLLTNAVAVPQKGEMPTHERFYYLELLRRCGLIDHLPDSSRFGLAAPQRRARVGLARFETLGFGRVTGVSPGAAFGTAKRWLPERFAEAVAQLGQPAALFGSKDERALVREHRRRYSQRGSPRP